MHLDLVVSAVNTKRVLWLAISPADCRFKPTKIEGLRVAPLIIKEVVKVIPEDGQ